MHAGNLDVLARTGWRWAGRLEGWRAGRLEGWRAGGLESWKAGRAGRLDGRGGGQEGWRAWSEGGQWIFKLPDLNRSFTLPLSSLGLGRPPHI